MSKFEDVKELVDYYIERTNSLYDGNIPYPEIIEAYEDDSCDFTTAEDIYQIRIKPANVDEDYHARHVLGHYIADLHTNPKHCDDIADLISTLIL